MEILLAFLLIAVLIFFNGVFVAAEFSVIGIRPSRVEQLAEEGNRIARRLRSVIRSPARIDRWIATAQLGITIASLGLGMVGEPAIAHLVEPPLHEWFGLEGEIVHTISFLLALGLITYLHIVLGEMIPKSLALQNAERVVLILTTPMLLIGSSLSWAITALNKTGLLTLRMLRIHPPSAGSRLHTPDELELIVSESVEGGQLEEEEQRLVSNIFDLADRHAAQLMTPRTRMDAVPVDIGEAELLERFFHSRHSRLPVYEENFDNIIGVVHLKDVIARQIEGQPFDLRAILYDVPSVPEMATAEQVLRVLKQKQVHLAVVIDEYGGTAGIVTLEDVIEEVMGDVRDEFDAPEPPPITVIAPGHLIARGDTLLDDLREYVDFGDNDYAVDTIGGLLLSHVNLPPVKGDSAEINGITLQAEEVKGLAIERVSVRWTPTPESGESGEIPESAE